MRRMSWLLLVVVAAIGGAGRVAAQSGAIEPPKEASPAPPAVVLDELARQAAGPGPASAAPAARPQEGATASATPGGGRNEAAREVEASQEFVKTGLAPVMKGSQSIVYPYGESQPEVLCAPLRACDIELQAGETIFGVALGDTERWETSPLTSGDPANAIPHVVCKPKDFGIATNIVIGTSRRTYQLSLVSATRAEAEDAGQAYKRHVRFYYPNELVQQWHSARVAEEEESRRKAATMPAPLETPDVAALDFDSCKVKVPRGSTRIAPNLVVRDKAHTYLRFGADLRAGDAPALVAQVSGRGPVGILNYRTSPDGRWYVADGLFDLMRLVVGVGRDRQQVDIECR